MSKQSEFETFLARVDKIFISDKDFLDLNKDDDYIKIHNSNKKFTSKDPRFLGAIKFDREEGYKIENYAFPFDKNNLTYPIVGETVVIIKFSGEYFYLPYTVVQYPNYREDYKTTVASQAKPIPKPKNNTAKQNDYKSAQGGSPGGSGVKKSDKEGDKYKVSDKIKFLQPKTGDTIITGRVGNTVRFSEFHLVEDKKTTSPGIFIRNFQNPKLDDKPIGTLIEEDINEDGSSIYIVSNKIKVPFKETIKKEKVAFKDYPKEFKDNQIYLNSDRVIFSAKKEEFIIFSKKSAGFITDARFNVDAKDEIYLHNEKNITLHTKSGNQIFLNSNTSGKVFLGKDGSTGDDGAAVQHMVLAGELKKLLEELIDEINKQVFLTPCGPSAVGPTNAGAFSGIKSKLKKFYSARNFLAKD
jgi:hypothetical protein